MAKKTIEDIQVKGKRVLVRCDFNVPMDENKVITDENRLRGALPTIKYLLENGAAVIACSHLGKPKGEWKPNLSLKPVAKRLSELLGMDVIMAEDIVGEDAKAKAAALQAGQIMLLENLRFDKREEKNDPEFAKELASMAEVYVSDAFGTVHRAHASTAGVAAFLPAYAGMLVEKEISVMGKALSDPARPFVAILGGAKVSDKIGVINNLLDIADTIIVGGGMTYTFIKAMGGTVGTSLLEDDWLDYCKEMMAKAKEKGVKLLLPVDTVCADAFSADAKPELVDTMKIPDGRMGMDIGPKTIQQFSDAVKDAGTVIWNGPMGVFEFPAFAEGTRAIAKALAAGAVLRGAAMYSSMEPCSQRKSEPESCTQLILRHGFARVVFALYEPDRFVCCRGAQTLREAGVDVRVYPELAEGVRRANAHLGR